MGDIFIAINRFYSRNKFILWLLIIIVVVFLLFGKAMKKNRDKSSNSSSNNTTTIVADFNNKIANKTDTEIIESISSNEELIKSFIYFCNNKKIDSAYDMISDSCKETLYPTKEVFVSDYYNKYFQGYRDVEISSYNSEGTYRINFLSDMLASGSTEQQIVNTDYISVISKKKIAISRFISSNKAEKIGSNQYVRANVLRKSTYTDHYDLVVRIDNLISAEMYLDDINENGSIYCIGQDGEKYKVNIQNYTEEDLKLAGNESKTITLEFDKSYNFENVSELLFENIRINNYEYGDEYNKKSQYIPGSDEEITYDIKKTDFPERIRLSVNL